MDELYDDLVRDVDLTNQDGDGELMAAAPSAAAMPRAVRVFMTLFVARLKVWGCANRDVLIAQAKRFIDERVTNPWLASAMVTVLETAVESICGPQTASAS